MKGKLRLIAALLVMAAAAFWLAAGANRGWTRNRVPIKSVDEVTGLEGITYQKQFVPGLDFLGAAIIGAGLLAGASFLFRNPNIKT